MPFPEPPPEPHVGGEWCAVELVAGGWLVAYLVVGPDRAPRALNAVAPTKHTRAHAQRLADALNRAYGHRTSSQHPIVDPEPS